MLGEIAADQWGLVTAAQAVEAGVEKMTLSRLTSAGMLTRIGHGVYGITAAGLPSHAEIRAAWLRLDPGRAAWQRRVGHPDSGVISHTSACLLHDIGDIPANRVEITVPRRRSTREPDVGLLRGDLEPTDVTVINGLPVTTAERTIADLLARHTDGGHIGGVIADAQRSGLLDIPTLADRVAPYAKAYGARARDGRALLALLLENVGEHLRDDQALAEAAHIGAVHATARLLERLDDRAVRDLVAPSVLARLSELHVDTGAYEALQKALAPMATANAAAQETLQQALALTNTGAFEALQKSLAPMATANAAAQETLQQALAPTEISLARALSPALQSITADLDRLLAPIRSIQADYMPQPAWANGLDAAVKNAAGLSKAHDDLVKMSPAWSQVTRSAITNHVPKAPRTTTSTSEPRPKGTE